MRRLASIAVWVLTLLVLAVVTENWLGARAWRSAVAEMRAADEPVEPAQVIPPPASDAENFAAIPLFRPLFDVEVAAGPVVDLLAEQVPRDPAGKARLEQLTVPAVASANWRAGQLADLAAWARDQKIPEGDGSPGAAILRELAKFDPELDALREAVGRTRSRFPIRYEDHVSARLPHLQVLMNFERILEVRTLAELSESDATGAHRDLLLGCALEEAPREEPLLISSLVRIACLELLMAPLWEALAHHQWDEAQLASLDAALQRMDFVAAFQFAIRGERVVMCTQALDAIKKDPRLLLLSDSASPRQPNWGLRAVSLVVPDGWIDFNKAALSRVYGELIGAADPAAHRFHPQQIEQVAERFKQQRAANRYNPRRALAQMVFPAVSQSGLRFASAQATVDLARTAIALERYRLAHGVWPESLAALPRVPVDVIGGAPLHYRHEPDGAFTVYSIGWNERDDGGVAVWVDPARRSVDWNQGDWVWPAYPRLDIEARAPAIPPPPP
jgi:hypothetical protein